MADEEKKDDTPNRIMVYLRVRNAKPGEISAEAGTKELMEVSPDKKVVNVEGGKTYNFDHIFYGKEGHNHEIYQIVGRPVVENIFKGYWGALMVYGQTGTGKSFTMCNFDKGNEGIIPGAMQDVFNKAALETDRTVTVTFSFIQIYLDKLQDLFNPNCKEELKLTRDAKGVAFPGIVERVCTNYEDFKANYDDGHQYRVITATKMNPESSRGHAALFIQVKSVPKDPSGEVRNGKLFMIDLAGYERFSKTGVQEGLMKEEAKTINASLLALGNVVQSLAEKSEHIPWRNAKLTRMLEDAIGGKAKCSIILTAGPSNEHNHETLGTLYFGSRAMSVKTTSGPMIVMDYKKLSAKLQELLDLAYSKINSLELSAQKRALEREEAEVSLNNERASLKQRQEAEVKKLMDSGASQDQIAALIAANKKEEELLSEQQAEQRELLNAQQDEDLQHVIKRGEQEEEERTEHVKTGMNQEVQKLQRELARTKEELERMKIKAKEADAEARRLLTELNDAKVQLAKNGITLSVDDDDLLGGRNMSPVAQTGNKALLATPEIRKELDRRVESVKRMLEETHELRLQEVEEPLQEEIARLKGLYEEAQATVDAQLQAQKDALSAMYEAELEKARTTANDVQEKLKKNHMTVKQSYQKQKEALQDENENLTRQLAELQARVGGDPGTAGAAVPARAGVPSLAEVMIMKKQTERKVDEMQQLVNDLKADLDYIQTEKAALERQLKEYEPTQGEDRLKPAQVRKLKEDHDALKAEKDKLEKELFKLRAEQALSGPQKVTNGGGDEDEAVDDLDAKEDMFGDAEGMKVFCDKVLKFPYYMGKEKVNSTHEHVLSTLATDLDEYRRSMKIRIILMGSQGTGKTSAVKCMTTTQPLIRSAPDVQPTVHPLIQVGTVEDIMTSKSEWHQLYVKFEDLQQENKSASILGRMASVVGVGGNGVADPAKIHVDLVDFPGSDKFWRGMPPSFLPGKNVCYTVVYNLNQPLDVIRDEIGRQLKIIHASAHRNYPKSLGGDAPRVAVCLLGTHRESLRETKDTPVLALLNRIISSLGDTFFTLRGEDTYGLVLLGNFAVSCSEWSVLGNRGPKHPTNFRDLFTFIATTATRLYDTRPSALLPTVKDSTSHTTYTLQAGDDAPLEGPAEKTSTMNETDKRLRKGIVTLLTALAREVKVRWVMSDAEMRTLIAHHIGVAENTKGAINAINYIMRELICRGIVMPLPGPLYEPKYLPKHKDDYPQDFTPLPRDGAIVLDPLRLVVIYSAFISLQHIQTVPKDILKDKNVAFFDVNALEKLDTAWQNGIVTQSVVQLVENRFVGLTCSDAKLMIELLCIMGFGLPLKQEPAMIAPMHFAKPMAAGLVDYISYLLSNHGDGIGRKYKLNTLPAAFVARLQTVLIPFSHAPTKDVPFVEQNWSDASYLAFDKARLKWGIFGSKIVKDAVFASQLPVRGILKVEGDYLYVAITARGPSTAAMMAAVRPVLNAVHHHITALCRREFRGVTASFQEMVIAGCETKRPKLTVGIPHILDRLGATADEIAVQVGAISTMSDPKGTEIDVALAALPMLLKFDSE